MITHHEKQLIENFEIEKRERLLHQIDEEINKINEKKQERIDDNKQEKPKICGRSYKYKFDKDKYKPKRMHTKKICFDTNNLKN